VAHIYEVEENGTRLSLPDEPNFLLHKRAVEFGKKGNLSRSMVKMLFEGEIQQQNVDNCYLLAAFYSLRQCPHFEVLMSRAIRKQKNGWIVRFPFGSEKAGKEIPVSDAELSLAQPVAKQGGGTDMLMPVKGNVGWRLLEAAYTKLVTGSMNRKATSWGNASPALREIFGKAVDPAFDASLKPEKPISDDAKLKEKVLLYLRNFHPGKDIATCSSLIPPVLPGGKISYTKQSFTGPVELFPRHAYSVESVDRIHRMVTVKNPHDTSRPLIFTFDQFCDAFREVDHVELSRENLFSENEMPAIGYRTNNPKIKPSPQPTPPKRRGGPPPPPPPRSLKSRSVGRKSTDSVLTN
jgi:hypothetical protein